MRRPRCITTNQVKLPPLRAFEFAISSWKHVNGLFPLFHRLRGRLNLVLWFVHAASIVVQTQQMLIFDFKKWDVTFDTHSVEVEQEFGVQLILPILDSEVSHFFHGCNLWSGLGALCVRLSSRRLRRENSL